MCSRLLLSMLGLSLAFAFSGEARAQGGPVEVFIGTAGSDANAGTVDAPVATFERALVLVGNASGTVSFLPGDYPVSTVYVPSRPAAPQASLLIRPRQAGTVRILPTPASPFLVGVSGSNVTLRGLRLQAPLERLIQIEVSAKNLVIEGCRLDQTGSPAEYGGAVHVNGSLTPILEGLVIRDCIFIGTGNSALRISNPVRSVHFIQNTVHIPASGAAVSVETDGYSGMIITNNIVNHSTGPGPRPAFEFTGKGTGTRIDLNCFSAPAGSQPAVVSGKVSSHDLKGLALGFRTLNPADPDAGVSLRGPCMDIYATERLSVLK